MTLEEILLASLSTEELVILNNRLSGGRWLGQVRRRLNYRVPSDRDFIRPLVGAHSWDVIVGRFSH